MRDKNAKTLQNFSTTQIEEAIGRALTDLLGDEIKVSLIKVDFSNHERTGGVGVIPVELNISRPWKPAETWSQ